MKVIAITNLKGGTGKTAISVNLSVALQKMGKKILLVDLDAQGSASISLNERADKNKVSIYEVLTGDYSISDAITETAENIDIVSADERLNKIESEISIRQERGQIRNANAILKKALASIKNKYDYVILDTPPALSFINSIVLTASDGVIIPTKADYLSFDGYRHLESIIDQIQKKENKELKLLGVVLTFYNGRRAIDRAIEEQIDKKLLFKTKLTNACVIPEATLKGKSVISYAPKSKASEQFKDLAEETLKKLK